LQIKTTKGPSASVVSADSVDEDETEDETEDEIEDENEKIEIDITIVAKQLEKQPTVEVYGI